MDGIYWTWDNWNIFPIADHALRVLPLDGVRLPLCLRGHRVHPWWHHSLWKRDREWVFIFLIAFANDWSLLNADPSLRERDWLWLVLSIQQGARGPENENYLSSDLKRFLSFIINHQTLHSFLQLPLRIVFTLVAFKTFRCFIFILIVKDNQTLDPQTCINDILAATDCQKCLCEVIPDLFPCPTAAPWIDSNTE